jgi:hypothetical protein
MAVRAPAKCPLSTKADVTSCAAAKGGTAAEV